MSTAQTTLSQTQIAAFYHDVFVDSQVRSYLAIVPRAVPAPKMVVDVGGGCGYFAESLRSVASVPVRVVDTDARSIAACHARGLQASLGDALKPEYQGDEDVVCFNLILHHLVGRNESATLALQKKALENWHGRAKAVFVDEYIYDSYLGNLSGRIIYAITSSRRLSQIGQAISHWVPSLRANTFGIGVRFRAHYEWLQVFESLGYQVVDHVRGPEEHVSVARRLLLIRSCRRDSYLLKPTQVHTAGSPGSTP